ncbi:amino acid permease [Fodinicola feengrottensis]|uniref:amino acid permease n=1 Tax=Fodinicola feengrottensis TaxID=435914 RepID=UPI0013D67F80|nr:amino acid permease [Fodinicola feengrottensis]
MANTVESPETAAPAGLKRALSSRQIAMMAIGSAIGTGLFLGSGLAISFAGPAVIVAYVIGAVVALAVAYALAEMTVAHPEAAGFGAIAARYLGAGAGFVQRWIYWTAVVVNIGAEVVAAGIYVRFWWPGVPLWVPAVGFSVLMLVVNVLSVRFFGEFEFWFAMIKVVVTIVLFVLIGVVAIVTGLPGHPASGLRAVTAYGGFTPNGLGGIWLALTVVTFSYLGTEAVAVAAGESKNPRKDVPRAARSMVLRLGLFYILAIAVVIAIVPWTQTAKANGVSESPFVQLFTTAGVPAAAVIMNFVVLTAALSAMNSNLYVGSRMVHSLALDGMAPRLAGVSSRGVPVRSLGLSAVGLALAIGISLISPDNAFAALVGLALFGALVTWLLIFATLLAFRRRRAAEGQPPSLVRLRGGPVPVVLAMIFLVSVIVTTAFTPQFWIVLPAGVPFLVALCLAYLVVRTIRRSRAKTQSAR